MSRGTDGTNQDARPMRHNELRSDKRKNYEHPDITDNRLTWEVLEEGETE